ncbi:MAG: NAD(P)-binding domain-containing protein [Pseudomonadota bacterium]
MQFEIIGGGNLGSSLARLLTGLGHAVQVQVQNPNDEKYGTLAALPNVELAATGKADANADMIFLATPWVATLGAVEALGDLSGRTLVDCTNPVTYGASGMALAIDANSSATEMIAAQASSAIVAKCFNQLGTPVLDNLTALQPTPIMGIACDDQTVATNLKQLASDMGFDAIHVGGLANARLLESFALLWMSQAFSSGDPSGFAFARSAPS